MTKKNYLNCILDLLCTTADIRNDYIEENPDSFYYREIESIPQIKQIISQISNKRLKVNWTKIIKEIVKFYPDLTEEEINILLWGF